MHYNNKEKRTTKTVEINNIELQKCRTGKRFKVDVITKSRAIIVDPPRISLDERIAKAVTKSIAPLRELVEQLVVDMSDVKDTLKEHSEILKRHGEILKRHDAMFKEHGWIK